jgi:hypothetical protein
MHTQLHHAACITEQERQCKYNVPLKRVHLTIVAVGKTMSITYSECVSTTLVIQHVKRMNRVVTCSLSDSKFLSHYLMKGTVFEKKYIAPKICFLVFFTYLYDNYSI